MEQAFVAWAKMRALRLAREHSNVAARESVKLGIGDDAAVLDSGDEEFVVTSDSMLEGVHFVSQETSGERIGRKLANINLSDLAAMAAEPLALFPSFCLPLDQTQAADAMAAEIFEGICRAAEECGVIVAGGDTNCWTGPLALHLTAVGKTVKRQIWRRNGAAADDLIVVTGPLGGSITSKQFDFEPRFDIVRKLRFHPGVHAAMDISDGLSVDLLRMCDASGCGAILELEEIPVSEAAQALARSGKKQAIEHALGDGEDFELLLAVAPDAYQEIAAEVGQGSAVKCGTFTSRTGLWMRDGGKIRQLASTGYIHGR